MRWTRRRLVRALRRALESLVLIADVIVHALALMWWMTK
jgi:hypothetical protein